MIESRKVISILAMVGFVAVVILLANCSASTTSAPQKSKSGENGSAQSSPAMGGMDGGGGMGVLCGDQLRVLDLYEATEVHRFRLSRQLGTLEEILKDLVPKVVRYQSDSPPTPKEETQDAKNEGFRDIKELVLDRMRFLPKGKRLEFTNDATLPGLPPACSIVQIAIYRPDGVIDVDQELWNKLDEVNRAALVLHEILYLVTREYGPISSDEARKVVGMIFSDTAPEPMYEPVWNARKKLVCVGGIVKTYQGSNDQPVPERRGLYELYLIDESREGKSGLGIYVRIIDDESVATRTSTFIPGETTENVANGKAQFSGQIRNNFRSSPWTFNFTSFMKYGKQMISFRAWLASQSQPPWSSGWCEFD